MLYIEVDLGTSAIKLLLVDGSGRIHKVVSREYPLHFPHPGWSEQNPEDWPTASIDGMEKLTSEYDKSQMIGISSGGQMHGLVTLDEADKVICPAILWDDGRSERETDYPNQDVGKGKLSAYTTNTASTGFMAPKTLWVKKDEPGNFVRICRIVLPGDYLAYRLFGSSCTDYFDASGVPLLDVTHKCWSEEMMEIYGITRKQLPDLYESYQVVGNLKEELTKELGFTQDVGIIAGAGDNTTVAMDTGTVGEGCCNTSLGTSGTIFISSESFRVNRNSALHSSDRVDGHFHLIRCMLSATPCNKWWAEEILKMKEFSREQKGIVKLGENHVFYLPYLMRERSPHSGPKTRACFIGMTTDTSREEIAQAVSEGVIFGLRNSLEVARGLSIRIDRTKTYGGGAKSPLWRKMVANVMNVKTDVVENEEDPTLGGVVLVAVGCREYLDAKTAVNSTAEIIEIIGPGADLTERHERQYGRFGQMYPAFRTIFRNLGE